MWIKLNGLTLKDVVGVYIFARNTGLLKNRLRTQVGVSCLVQSFKSILHDRMNEERCVDKVRTAV